MFQQIKCISNKYLIALHWSHPQNNASTSEYDPKEFMSTNWPCLTPSGGLSSNIYESLFPPRPPEFDAAHAKKLLPSWGWHQILIMKPRLTSLAARLESVKHLDIRYSRHKSYLQLEDIYGIMKCRTVWQYLTSLNKILIEIQFLCCLELCLNFTPFFLIR